MGGACVGVAVCSLNARHSFQSPPSSSSSSRSYVDLASPRWGTALQTTLNSPKPFHQAYRCSETLDVHHRRLEDRKRPAISRGHCRHGHGFARQAHKANLNKANGKASNSAEDKAAGAKRVPQVRRQTCRHCTAPACCCGSPAARTQTLKVTPTAGVMWLRVKGGGCWSRSGAAGGDRWQTYAQRWQPPSCGRFTPARHLPTGARDLPSDCH
jgi:hypothetical protein